MAQSLGKIYLHIIFATRHCIPFFADLELRRETHRFLIHQCRTLGSPAIALGGTEDHVHLLTHNSRVDSTARMLSELKRTSSVWIKTKCGSAEPFTWQDGYGAFSISPSHVQPLSAYIAQQEEHHRSESFQQEMRRLTAKYGVDFDDGNLEVSTTLDQSIGRIYLHVVFSTKHRLPFLDDPELRRDTYRFMTERCDKLECPALAIGGVSDHVHLLIQLPRVDSTARVIGELKRSSSLWIKKNSKEDSFYWQNGYGAFSISPGHIEPLCSYIDRQEEHHRNESFQDETRRLAARYGVVLDEQRAWK